VRRVVSLVSLTLVAGCVPRAPEHAPLPPLQVREFQTRTYETTDTKMVMKALLNVLQDDGFVIKTANTDLGLITARKEQAKPPCFLVESCATLESWDCSVNVSEFGKETKVRVNVQLAGQTLTGHVLYSSEIDDPGYFRDFFARVDKGIFIQKEKL
jgi:hypothetical protein